jgi:phage terminase small subunit
MSDPAIPAEIETVTLDDLTDRQRAFVRALVESGGGPGAAVEAARTVGYAPTSAAAARVRAHELLRNPKVLAALRDEIMRKLNAAAALGVNVLIELAQSGPPQVRLSAAKELVDRGFGPVVSRSANLHAVTATSVEALLDQLDEAEAKGYPIEEGGG